MVLLPVLLSTIVTFVPLSTDWTVMVFTPVSIVESFGRSVALVPKALPTKRLAKADSTRLFNCLTNRSPSVGVTEEVISIRI